MLDCISYSLEFQWVKLLLKLSFICLQISIEETFIRRRSGDRIPVERDLPQASRSALGPTKPPIYNEYRSFPGVKRPRRGVDHETPSGTEVKERVELYFYSHLYFRGLL